MGVFDAGSFIKSSTSCNGLRTDILTYCPCPELSLLPVLHGETSKRLAQPRNTKDRTTYLPPVMQWEGAWKMLRWQALAGAPAWCQWPKPTEAPCKSSCIPVTVYRCEGWTAAQGADAMTHAVAMTHAAVMTYSREWPGPLMPLNNFLFKLQS